MTNEAEQNSQNAQNPETKVEKMFEYGYRKSNYGPDELVTDAHGNPISVVDAMLSAEKAATTETVTPHLCYYSPRIPGNTGSAIRLCAVTGTILHLVEPLGFNLRDTKLRRAGLDYHDMAHVVLHPNFDNLVESMPNSRIIAFTAHATKLYTEVEYKPTDILLFGPEPGDIPAPDGHHGGPACGRAGATAHAPVLAFPEPHQLRVHRHLRSLAPTQLRWRALRRRPGGPSSSDAERTPTGVREETLSLAARPSSQKMGLSALRGADLASAGGLLPLRGAVKGRNPEYRR